MNTHRWTRTSLVLGALGTFGASLAGCGNATTGLQAPAQQLASRTRGRQQLAGHLSDAARRAPLVGRVPAETRLPVTIGLVKPNRAALDAFAAAVSDPSSPAFRAYLSDDEFAARFGAPAADYQALVDWARAHHLDVETHGDRLTAHLTGAVADLEAAFHVHFHYALRPDGTQFHVVDAEPSLDSDVPVEHISNLEDLVQPRRGSQGGSGAQGEMTGTDFRNAYVPGTTLTGAGQTVGIGMFQGAVTTSDITSYVSTKLNQSALLPQFVIGDGVQPTAAAGKADTESTLDFEMVLSMAPQAQTVGFTAISSDTLIGNMEARTDIKQFTISYTFGGDPNIQTMLEKMAIAGQSVVVCSGDNGAPGPGSLQGTYDSRAMPWLTVVGGTNTTMSGNGASWTSEVAWSGSGGGVESPQYEDDQTGVPIPFYQVGLASRLSSSVISTQYRNYPDVSAEGTGVNIYINGQTVAGIDGTSVATPLWGGFIALANQQATSANEPTIGFANPVLYTVSYADTEGQYFHDITSGSNPCVQGGANKGQPCLSSGNPSFSATVGYDLVTGLGSPQVALLGQLAGYPRNCTATWECSGPPGYTGGTNISCGVALTGYSLVRSQWDGNNPGPFTPVSLTSEGPNPLAIMDWYDPGVGIQLTYVLESGDLPYESQPMSVTTTDCSCHAAAPVCPSGAQCGAVANACGQTTKCGGTCSAADVCSANHCCPAGESWSGSKCQKPCTGAVQCCIVNGGTWNGKTCL